MRDAARLLPEVEVAPLDIFNERQHRRRLLVRAHRQTRHSAQPRELCRPQAALARDQLRTVCRHAHAQRLQNAVLPDGIRQRL